MPEEVRVNPSDEQTAPYKRFRPTSFYGDVYANGTFTADLMDCHWSCESCWSRFGHRNEEPKYNLTAREVAEKLLAGMERNKQGAARISSGEPLLHWEHVVDVADEVLQRSREARIVLEGMTDPDGDPFRIVVETNGSLLTPARLDELERILGEDAPRMVLALGIKATSPEQLAELTGHVPATAQRFHAGQLDALMHIAGNTRLGFHGLFLDKFTDPEVFATIQRQVEHVRPGSARELSVEKFKAYSGTQRFYKPKRFRDD